MVGPENIDPFRKTIDQKDFENCAKEWFYENSIGKEYQKDLITNEDGDSILGYNF